MTRNPIDDTRRWFTPGVRKAKNRVTVVSPWLSGRQVKALLAVLPDRASLQVVFRWPQTMSDCGPLDAKAIELLYAEAGERPRTHLQFVNGPLHAKVYMVDGAACVTSANFTNAGFGSNIELGFLCSGQDVSAISDWVALLDTRTLHERAYQVLIAGLDSAASGEGGGGGGFPPPPEQPAGDRVAFAEETWSRCGIQAQHIDKGYGQNAWTAPLFRRKQAVVKAHVSVAKGDVFHFEVTAKDHKQLRRHRYHGLALLPCVRNADSYEPPPETPNVVLVSEAALYGGKGLQKRALRGHQNLSLLLERRGPGWRLCLPNPGGKGQRRTEAKLVRDRRWGGFVMRLKEGSWA